MSAMSARPPMTGPAIQAFEEDEEEDGFEGSVESEDESAAYVADAEFEITLVEF
jgi:hypothetical protein